MDEYTEIIRVNLPYLVDKMYLDDIEDDVRQHDILTKNMMSDVRAEKPHRQNNKFFELLQKRPNEKFAELCKVLREKQQGHIADRLDPDQLYMPQADQPTPDQPNPAPQPSYSAPQTSYSPSQASYSGSKEPPAPVTPRQPSDANSTFYNDVMEASSGVAGLSSVNDTTEPSEPRDTEDVLDTLDMDVTELEDDPNVYPMLTKPRGKCLIVNNVDFTSMPRREGSDVDARNLNILFTNLYFEVEVKRNVEKKAFNTLLAKFAADPAHSENSCMVLIILTHGKKDYVYSVDEYKIPVYTVIDRFNGQGCPLLNGKPKIIMIQACRGEKLDRGVRLQLDGRCLGKPTQQHIPTHADILVAYSTVYGYVAIRDTDDGSWFMQSVVEIFEKNSHKEHIVDMLVMVNEEVAKKVAELNGGSYKSIPQLLVGLRKKLYFFPKRNA